MKVWGIIATILMIAFLGTLVWMYSQNKDLKSKNDSLNSELTSTKTAKNQANAKITKVSQKVDVLKMLFAQNLDQAGSIKLTNLLNTINDTTLIADWKAMQNGKPGDDTGTKMFQDLSSAMSNDLK